MTHEAIRKALETLPAECRKPWRQLDGLPYLHATEDEHAKPWGTPVVGRFDYLETMTYIAACNPEAITALLADRDRLAAELEEANKDEQAAYERTARLIAEVESAANLLELAHVYMKDDGSPAFKTIEGRVKEFINRVDRSAAFAATPEVKP